MRSISLIRHSSVPQHFFRMEIAHEDHLVLNCAHLLDVSHGGTCLFINVLTVVMDVMACVANLICITHIRFKFVNS